MRRIAVGIGNAIHLDELHEIAGNYEDVIQVQSYGGLIGKLESIMKLACENQVLGKYNQSFVAIDKVRAIFLILQKCLNGQPPSSVAVDLKSLTFIKT